MSELNFILTLAARPVGFPKESDFNLIEEQVMMDLGDPTG
jgi:hypothetical protein